MICVKQNVARLLVLALLAGAPVAASPLVSAIVPEAGLLWIGNYDPRSASLAPNPLVGMLGVSVPLDVFSPGSPWLLAAGLDLFSTYYEYDSTNARAIPAEVEAGPGFFTLGVILGPRFGISFPPGGKVAGGAVVGLDLLLRFPLEFFNSDPASTAGRKPALAYFFGKGRFLYPETGLALTWRATEAVTLGFAARVLWPLFHLWDGLGLPLADELMAGGTVGLTIALR